MSNSIPKTIEAIEFIERAHHGQLRKHSGLPYIVHCFSVYSTVKEYKDSKNYDDLGAICLLHDVLEDTGATKEELEKLFGPMVADAVVELTNDPEEMRRMGKRAYVDEKLLKLSNYALVVKLADMLSNITDNPTFGTLERIHHHIDFLKSKRELTGTQKKIVAHIENYFDKI